MVKQEIDEVLVNMVEKDSEPFTIVEDEGIREFLQRTLPMFSLQGRSSSRKGERESLGSSLQLVSAVSPTQMHHP